MSDSLKIHNSTIRLVKGDITLLEVQAFVFYAQHDLQLGTGFGTAVTLRGGPSVQEELDPLGPIQTTDVVISGSGKLGCDYILHAVGPRFQEDDIESKLRSTVLNCLREADAKGITSLAFPAMGAGFYGIPLPVCAEVTLRAIRDYLSQETSIKEIVVCVLDSQEYQAFSEVLSSMTAPKVKA